jgi:dTMP kinase
MTSIDKARESQSKPQMPGLFVVIEGIDGAGTTTQAERYAAHLRARGREAQVTREPSTGPIGGLIRRVLTHAVDLPEAKRAETMALLFAADRIHHVEHEIAPALRAGQVVLSDRFDLSSLAYQSATSAGEQGRAATLAWIRELNRHARRPDITVVLNVRPEVAAERRRARGTGRELYDDAVLQAELAAAYRRAEDLVPGDRLVHIDGDAEPEAVTAAIAAAVDPLAGV